MEQWAYVDNKNFTVDAKKYTSCDHELANGEIWVANTSGNKKWEEGVDIPMHFAHLKTIRLGEQSYDIKGNPISRDYCRPLIIHKSDEAELNDIWMKRMSSVG